ncbi:hypothetical protein PFISCL1PPCAC_2548 [Pristionchus fissidentatus]|uniref:Uncharacterized protein n=1 Tax=Pristionchus fissidentatus TaxID=1538716 RepID=A0AAV5UVD2_9BILA|nr:hypothetical protein PFISCL1PPCAC_2548 [Pristionchus fissidentatus]
MEPSRPNHLTVPPNRPLHLDTNTLSPSPNPYADHSPALSMKIKVPKRQYSIDDPLQRMETPMFDKTLRSTKKGPSSAGTVLTMAGLFVVGLLLMISGIIVLIEQKQLPFIITGCLFLGIGLAMILVCIILQRKNVVKYILDVNRDLEFLNMSDYHMWKVMFENNKEDMD